LKNRFVKRNETSGIVFTTRSFETQTTTKHHKNGEFVDCFIGLFTDRDSSPFLLNVTESCIFFQFDLF